MVEQTIAEEWLARLRVARLRARYRDAYGEDARRGHRQHLVRRIGKRRSRGGAVSLAPAPGSHPQRCAACFSAQYSDCRTASGLARQSSGRVEDDKITSWQQCARQE